MLLSVEGVAVRYGSVTALRDASLHVDEGEIVALVGPNGAGKTSLLSAVMGLVRPAAGMIRFAGTDITGRRTEDIVRAGVVLVPEHRRLFAQLTIGDNLRLGALRRRDDVERDMQRVLERFPVLASRLDQPAGHLSGGEAQMLAFARAVIAAPRLLCMDEPSLGLAPLMVDAVFELIGDLASEGMTILLVEQNALQALSISRRAYVIRSGSLDSGRPAAELLDERSLTEAYLGTAGSQP